MIDIPESDYKYRLFGLHFVSQLALQESLSAEQLFGNSDCKIVLDHSSVSGLEKKLGINSLLYERDNDTIYFRIPDAAIYSISGGDQITVAPLPGADESKIRLYLLGTCMGALLMQRRMLPLHGSAVVINGKAYAIVGESGAGKSTLAAAFSSQGYSLLTDDVIAVKFADEESVLPTVYPSYPQQKLWQESLDYLGLSSDRYSSIFERVDKFMVPIPSRFHHEPLPLAGVIELTKTEEQVSSIRSYNRLESLHILHGHTYRNYLLNIMNIQQWHFGITTRIAAALPVYRLHRPQNGFTAYELIDQILSVTQHKEVVIHER